MLFISFKIPAPIDFLVAGSGWNEGVILGYVLTFTGTLTLGIITIYQNHIAQKKSDEVNALVIELQKKSVAMAEQQYKREKQNENIMNIPKFELKNEWSNGNYMNLHARLKNVSNNSASMIKSVSFEVSCDSRIISESNAVKSKNNFLLSGEETEIEFNNFKPLYEKRTDNNGVEILSTLNNIHFVWKFQCEDRTGRIHYYKATFFVEDKCNSVSGLWNVEKVG